MSMSVSRGRVAGHRHNVEAEYREGLENVDPERTPLNEVLVDVPLEEVYRREFGAALAAYNAKQVEKGFPGRQIPDYLEKIRGSKQEKPSYEMVVQVGNRDTNSAGKQANRIGSSIIYRDFLERFRREFPQLVVYQAVIHVDEDTPHIHVAYVPVSKGNKRGLETKNGLTGALKQMGYAGVKEANERIFALLEEVAAEHGVRRVDMGCRGAHIEMRDFKRIQAEIEQERRYPYKNDPELVALVLEQQEQLREMFEINEQQRVTIDSLTRHDPSPFTIGKIRQAVVEGRSIAEQLKPRIEACRGHASRFRQLIENMPVTWRDCILNPVSDRLRRQRERFVKMADEYGWWPKQKVTWRSGAAPVPHRRSPEEELAAAQRSARVAMGAQRRSRGR